MLGLSVIILFKSLLHVFCSLVFSTHNSSDLDDCDCEVYCCEFDDCDDPESNRFQLFHVALHIHHLEKNIHHLQIMIIIIFTYTT